MKYVPARKFFASLIILGKDSDSDKAEQIFTLYDNLMQGFLSVQQLREAIGHLFYLIIYAFPSMVDSAHP